MASSRKSIFRTKGSHRFLAAMFLAFCVLEFSVHLERCVEEVATNTAAVAGESASMRAGNGATEEIHAADGRSIPTDKDAYANDEFSHHVVIFTPYLFEIPRAAKGESDRIEPQPGESVSSPSSPPFTPPKHA